MQSTRDELDERDLISEAHRIINGGAHSTVPLAQCGDSGGGGGVGDARYGAWHGIRCIV
jgi:hypothetical protein